MTIDETSTLVFKIAALYPQFRVVPNVTVLAWGEVLADERFDDLVNALSNFARQSQHAFPPSPPELLERVRNIKRQRAINERAKRTQQLAISHDDKPTMTQSQRKHWMRELMKQAGFA